MILILYLFYYSDATLPVNVVRNRERKWIGMLKNWDSLVKNGRKKVRVLYKGEAGHAEMVILITTCAITLSFNYLVQCTKSPHKIRINITTVCTNL